MDNTDKWFPRTPPSEGGRFCSASLAKSSRKSSSSLHPPSGSAALHIFAGLHGGVFLLVLGNLIPVWIMPLFPAVGKQAVTLPGGWRRWGVGWSPEICSPMLPMSRGASYFHQWLRQLLLHILVNYLERREGLNMNLHILLFQTLVVLEKTGWMKSILGHGEVLIQLYT